MNATQTLSMITWSVSVALLPEPRFWTVTSPSPLQYLPGTPDHVNELLCISLFFFYLDEIHWYGFSRGKM
jgi:hypothetical protein